MEVNEPFSTSSNFNGLFLCISTNDSSVFWVFFPFLTLKHWETNSRICFQKLHLETGNEKISFNALEKKKILGKKDLGEKFW